MCSRMRVAVVLAIAGALLGTGAMAQKAPAPPPPPAPTGNPPGGSPTNVPNNPTLTNTDPLQPTENRVMYLRGRVKTSDNTQIPMDVLVERVCNQSVRQQVYATSIGEFTMHLGAVADSFVDASGEGPSSASVLGKNSLSGIPRRDLVNCDLRASASGFRSKMIHLAGMDTFGSNVDVGSILLERTTKVEGTTISAMAYKAPKDARAAYERGLKAEKSGKLADAQKNFEEAVKLHPKYLSGWFSLGMILLKEKKTDEAHAAFTQATMIDTKYLPPYISLAGMAYDADRWTELLALSNHILELDSFNRTDVHVYVVDMDPSNSAEAYYFNAVANYRLNHFEEAEKSALKAEHLNLRTRFPEVHLVLADIYTRKKNYSGAINEARTYLELAPNASNAEQVRAQLVEFEKLNAAVTAREKLDQN